MNRHHRQQRGRGAEFESTPPAETAVDTQPDELDDGPPDFLNYITENVRGKELLCCFKCAAPVIIAKRRLYEGEKDIKDGDALWAEVCAFAQGRGRTLKFVEASEQFWPKARGKLLHQKQYEHLKGQRVQERTADRVPRRAH